MRHDFFLKVSHYSLAAAIKCSKNCCIYLFALMMDVRKLGHLRGRVTFRMCQLGVGKWQMAFQ